MRRVANHPMGIHTAKLKQHESLCGRKEPGLARASDPELLQRRKKRGPTYRSFFFMPLGACRRHASVIVASHP